MEEIELSSSKEREIRDKTLGQAIENAKQQAARLAEGFGAKVGKVLTIETGEGTFGALYSMSAPTFGEATFQPGRISIESELSVVFELTD